MVSLPRITVEPISHHRNFVHPLINYRGTLHAKRLGKMATLSSNKSDGVSEAERVKVLEARANELHLLAQRYNKEGRYAEATSTYAGMHFVEDEASKLSAQLGCVTCLLGEESGSGCNATNADFKAYQSLYKPSVWPGSTQQGKQPNNDSVFPTRLLFLNLHPDNSTNFELYVTYSLTPFIQFNVGLLHRMCPWSGFFPAYKQ